jgi:hypothetical protein
LGEHALGSTGSQSGGDPENLMGPAHEFYGLFNHLIDTEIGFDAQAMSMTELQSL